MRHLSLSVLLLLASTCSQAQKRSLDLTIPPMGYPTASTCPIRMVATRNNPVVISNAQRSARTGPAASLHLHLSGSSVHSIEKLEITVYGTDPKGSIIPADRQASNNLKKTFHISMQSLVDFDVQMAQAGVIRWADLTSITYTDGTTWNAPTASTCRAVPSAFMLLSSNR